MKSLLLDTVMPDFAKVYSFIGSIFDSNASDHLPRLRKMDPINMETVCHPEAIRNFFGICVIDIFSMIRTRNGIQK